MYRAKRELKPLVYLITLILLSATLNVSSAKADDVPTSFSFSGSGYGHGVGMSQIGARGQALDGKNAVEILNYYYPGTAVISQSDSQTIRVNIGHLQSTSEFALLKEEGSFQILKGDLPAGVSGAEIGTYIRDIKVNFLVFGNTIIPQLTSPTAKFAAISGESSWTLRWSTAAIITSTISTQVMQLKYGQINLKLVQTSTGPKMEISNTLKLHDEYLWGIGEVPSSWPVAALQAQAIASRSFALSKVGKMRIACDCELYSSTQDQSFVGYSKELEKGWGNIWKAAVSSTSQGDEMGLALTYAAQPIAAYFFSSSAGQTVSAQDVWGAPVPYTLSVADPWSISPVLNPRYFHWERAIDKALVAQAFGLPDVARMEIAGHFESGTVSVIVATSSTGLRAQLAGEAFRNKVRLPSAWFDFLGPQMSDANTLPKPVRTIFHSL